MCACAMPAEQLHYTHPETQTCVRSISLKQGCSTGTDLVAGTAIMSEGIYLIFPLIMLWLAADK